MQKVKKVLKTIGIVILSAIIFISTLSFLGFVDVGYTKIFGTMQADARHEVFMENKAHVEGMIDDLADARFDFQRTESQLEKDAIADLINSKFANFDEDEIRDRELRNFLIDIRRGEY